MEGTYFEKKFSDMCKNFKFTELEEYDQEYLITMFNQIKSAINCPKTSEPFEKKYPNARKFKLYKDKAPEDSTNYGSHLLNGVKYYLVWDHD